MKRMGISGKVRWIAVGLALWLGLPMVAAAQDYDTLRIVTQNALGFCGSTCAVRVPAFRLFYQAINADIVVTQEQVSQSGVNQFLNDILNYGQPGTYLAAPWTDGPYTDNALFYKGNKVALVSTQQIPTQPSGGYRDISEYVLKPKGMDASGEFRVYSLHLKAGDTSGDAAIRLIEATVLRNYLNALPDCTDFFVMGDFNCYTSSESAYQKLVGSQADNSGRCFDPINTPGDWNNNYDFRTVHTQSTRTTNLNPGDGGSTGGMDDRFDQILSSATSLSPNWFACLPSTYTAYGNDGDHFNDSINDPPNAVVSQEIANALHRASDHLPVYVNVRHPIPTLTLTSPNGGEVWQVGQTDTIKWSSIGLAGNVTIAVNRDYPGGSWVTLFGGTANDGAQPWLVTSPTSANCRIRIVGDSHAAARDSSNANFTITNPYITVTSPNGGETWYWGQPHNILWSSGAGGTVDISLNRDFPGGAWESLFAGTANDGIENWMVSSPRTANARIRIVSTSNPSIRDSSDANFTIETPYLVLTVPDGGEIWTAGTIQILEWIGEGLTDSDSLEIQLNRNWPGPDWEPIDTTLYIWFGQDWPVTGPGTTTARMRIVSLRLPTVAAESQANFTIIGANEPPLIFHDPLDDKEPGNITIVASVFDEAPLISIKVFYREQGGAPYDSVMMNSTGNPYEYATTIGPLGDGSYDYYLRATDTDWETTTTEIYDFQVAAACGIIIGYDDGSAEEFNWAGGEEFRWAVKFTPATTPFILCGTEFSVSRIKPDSSHERVVIEVYDIDGQGLPGNLLFADTTGSVGNVVGGLPAGSTLWAMALLRDGSGEPLVMNGDFFLAVGNPDTLHYEAFARDITGPNSNRSYLYDGCEEQWFNENESWENCRIGNRLIRALGFYPTPVQVVISRSGNDIRLDWTSAGAPYYRIYSSTDSLGGYALEGSVGDTTFMDGNAVLLETKKVYRVVCSTQP
ncbi:MAG: hypothetical protein V1784_01445 [bacterium]